MMSNSPPSISSSRIFAIPQLDEDSLKGTGGAVGTNAIFANGSDKPAGSSGFTLVADNSGGAYALGGVLHNDASNNSNGGGSGGRRSPGASGRFSGGGSGVPSPTHHSAMDNNDFVFLQQQQQAAAVAAAAAQLEQDFYYTNMLLQQAPRPVLLAVLSSLIEDFPTTLINPVKTRLELFFNNSSALKGSALAMGGLGTAVGLPGNLSPTAGQSPNGRRTSAASFVPNSSAAPWSPSSSQSVSVSGGAPGSSTHSPSHSRGANSSGGKGKKNKEEQEMCSVHHTMRAVKHLQRNPATGQYRCIHGFHCLLDEPVVKKDDAPAVSAPERRESAPGLAAYSKTLQLQNHNHTSSGGYTVVGADVVDVSTTVEVGGGGHANRFRAYPGSGSRHPATEPVGSTAASRFTDPSATGTGVSTRSTSDNSARPTRQDETSPADEELLAYTLKLLQSVRDIEEEE